ncbi:ABSCISIC ACID-INSENSITIVE 5-like protein 7 [Humulus lupulus]|uniref:ABSCISIC ACID-INSENSITIVE 5-like protein 7 n=1 Tax=Humulus lupulus TaxID=3486 RepID=UPI002B411601|nr:ABSCISIC ACID-INSENSITIVE 5-like protein 7 [Humulus lupulus]
MSDEEDELYRWPMNVILKKLIAPTPPPLPPPPPVAVNNKMMTMSFEDFDFQNHNNPFMAAPLDPTTTTTMLSPFPQYLQSDLTPFQLLPPPPQSVQYQEHVNMSMLNYSECSSDNKLAAMIPTTEAAAVGASSTRSFKKTTSSEESIERRQNRMFKYLQPDLTPFQLLPPPPSVQYQEHVNMSMLDSEYSSDNKLAVMIPTVDSTTATPEAAAVGASSTRSFKKTTPSEESIERRQNRMFKNRESAARSRARKQKAESLKKRIEFLVKLREIEKQLLSSYQNTMPKFQLRRTNSAPF